MQRADLIPEADDELLGAGLVQWLEWGVAVLAGLVVGSSVLVALVHANDAFGIDHVAGTWLALARYVNEGVLYPALYDGSNFGGTRFMPLQFVLHAGLARLTGEYVFSANLLAHTNAAILVTLTFLIARRLSSSSSLALGLVAAVLVTETGRKMAFAVRGDALPVSLQLVAVELVTRLSRRTTVAASFLCALAVLSKFSALWGAIAITLWLGAHYRRRLALFVGSLAIFLGSGLALFELLSRGRMLDNIVELSFAGAGGGIRLALTAPETFIALSKQSADATWLLVPLALIGLVSAFHRRRLTIYQVSFLIALLIVVVELSDKGAYRNHLIDFAVLTAILVAEICGTGSVPRNRLILRSVALVTLIFGIGASFPQERQLVSDAVRALAGRGASQPKNPLANEVDANDVLLSEDPFIPVSLGKDPVVLDAFMLLRILRGHPAWEAQLVGRIDDRRFTKIVLLQRLDPVDSWWQNWDFGPVVSKAIARNYRLMLRVGQYWLYTPKPDRAVPK
jgi:hypothetical protein